MKNPLEVRAEGLYCKPGNFYIDAWSPVKHCVVTHAHADHARFGHESYLATENTADIILQRYNQPFSIEKIPYGKKIKINECWISLHPAGHILGSAQIRIETKQCVCVISGDYKRVLDPTCEPFELLECDLFVSESTFGLPIYNWENSESIIDKIIDWWQENSQTGHASVLFCYSLGKAQRLLALLKAIQTPIYVHGAILPLADLYKKKGILMADYLPISAKDKGDFSKELILAPPSAKGTPWMKRFFPYRTALASGWMQVRGTRKRKNLDRGFAFSDHADWPDLLKTIKETKASLVLTTHGNAATLARYLKEHNVNAHSLAGMEWLDEGEGD